MEYFQQIKTFLWNEKFENICDKLVKGSVEVDLIQIMCYMLMPYISRILLFVELLLVKSINLSDNLFFTGVIFIICVCVLCIEVVLLFALYRLSFKLIKSKRFGISLLPILNCLIVLYMVLSWLKILLTYILNFLSYNFYFVNNSNFLYETGDFISILSKLIYFFYCLTMTLTILNVFLPEKLQSTELSLKQRLFRMGLKVFYLFLFGNISYIFSIINKENFGTILIFSTLFTFLCTPKIVLRVFTNIDNIERKNISENIYIQFERIKFMFYLIILSWSISIYIFNTQDIEVFFLICLFIFFIMGVVRGLLEKYSKKLFSSWIVNDKQNYRKWKSKNNS